MRVHATRGGLVKIDLGANERQLLRDLAYQLAELIGESGLLATWIGGTSESGSSAESNLPVEAEAVGYVPTQARPQNPIIDRLFPDAYHDDEAAAQEFRRFSGPELARLKAADAEILASTMSGTTTLTLDEHQLQPWLRSITDLRLALAVRLGIKQDGDEGSDAPEDATIRAAYWWLGELQERLVHALALVHGAPPGT